VYAGLASNLFHHGIYGLQAGAILVPKLIRVPGYPLCLPNWRFNPSSASVRCQ
jgi:hypothetical protein